jgi:branched-chain amino acid transport system ATP-binding protein
MNEIILETVSVSKSFGGIKALTDVSLSLKKGEILGLIGPNGAGKTTLFNIIAGKYNPTSGQIFFNQKDITKLGPDKVAKMGIARTFQIVQTFNNLSVLENVLAGALFGQHKITEYEESIEESFKALKFIEMEDKADRMISSLVLTDRKKIELARAIATDPQIILLDELIAGLNPSETDDFLQIIKNINKTLGKSIIIVEHVMKAVMSISDRIFVLNYGQKIAEGTPQEITTNQNVIEAYLGSAAGDSVKYARS